jgi:hypothetical protein
LECLGRSVARSLFTKGYQETRGQDRPGAWESLKQGEVGLLLGTLRDSVVAVGNALQGDVELGHERLHEQGVGGGMPPASVVHATARVMASLRVVITSAERTWWARKKLSSVVRRARCAALSVGQRLRKAQKIAVSWS